MTAQLGTLALLTLALKTRDMSYGVIEYMVIP